MSSYSGNQTFNRNMHKYFKIFVSLYDQEWVIKEDGHSSYDFSGYDYELEKCSSERFNNKTSFNTAVNLTGNYLCIKNSTI